jgi:hypothetical protein
MVTNASEETVASVFNVEQVYSMHLAERSYVTLVTSYETTWGYNREDLNHNRTIVANYQKQAYHGSLAIYHRILAYGNSIEASEFKSR